MVEIVVVLLIVCILSGMSLMWMTSGKTAGNTARGVAAAEAYASAIEQFGTDNRGIYPQRIGSADWPVAKDGPIHPLSRTNGRYLRTIPEIVDSGDFRIGSQGTVGMMTYAVSSDRSGYELKVFNQLGEYRCSFSTNFPGSGQPCVKR